MQKYFWVIILTLVLLLAVVFIQRLKETPKTESPKNQETKQDSNQPQDNKSGYTDNTLRGVLKLSNDKDMGNLMLLLADSDRIIYLHTTRNYNDLIETPVIVTIEGDLTNFKLVKIESEEKD